MQFEFVTTPFLLSRNKIQTELWERKIFALTKSVLKLAFKTSTSAYQKADRNLSCPQQTQDASVYEPALPAKVDGWGFVRKFVIRLCTATIFFLRRYHKTCAALLTFYYGKTKSLWSLGRTANLHMRPRLYRTRFNILPHFWTSGLWSAT